MTVIETIATWAAETPPDWSAAARERALHAIADTVACMVSGAGDPAAKGVRETLGGWAAPGAVTGATVIGAGWRLPAPMAAFANGTAAHAQDFDDNFMAGLTHASAVLVPALLALGEETDADGRDLVDAYVVGLECHAAVSRGVNRSHYLKGWHATATVGCIGTAAACARLAGLDAARTAHAMSLATSMAAGLKGQFGSHAKPFQAGMAAQNAVMAASFAATGVEGRTEVLENDYGFLNLFGGDAAPGWDFGKHPLPDAGAGVAPVIETVGLAPKCHPCCGSTHKSIDNLLDLKRRHDFGPGDVTAIHARVNTSNVRNLCFDDPRNDMEARFSMQYCLAVALARGFLSLRDFTDAAVARPEIRALLPLTTMSATPPEEELGPAGPFTHELTVTLKSGEVLTASRTAAKGTLGDPFTDEDRRRKFEDCCTPALGATATAALLAACESLETAPSLTEFMAMIPAKSGDKAA